MASVIDELRYRVRRFMSAASYGIRSGYAVYRDEDNSIDSAFFDTYEARISRYGKNMVYAENKQYNPANRLKYPSRYVKRYKHMRAIYNFVSRLVDLEVNKTYGGRIDWAGDLATGAIPIVLSKNTSPIVIECIKQILEWSNFGDGKDKYVRNGATLGDSFLKAVNVKDEQDRWTMVYIEVLDPHVVKDFDLDRRGNVKRIVIEYEKIDEPDGKTWMYREEIDKEWFRYYRDDELTDEEPNVFKFVPVTFTPHKHVVGGKKSGVTSFHNTLNKLDEMNDGASVAKDGQRKANNPMLAVIGGKLGIANTELRDRDDLLVFEGGDEGITIETITPQTDTAGSIAIMEREENEITSDNPALALQNLRKQGGELSGVAIENYYGDASDSLEAIQGRYDERLIRILQMAMTMAGMMKLEGFPFTIESYDKGEMRFYIKERKVFSDRIPEVELQRLIMEAAASEAAEVVLKNLGVPQEDIDLIMAGKKEREAAQAAAAIRGLAQGFGMDEDETDEEEPTQPDEEAVNVD
jgi:hypothetical protein